ncbi:MAG TPA: hypothetical protein VG899_03655 [Mycobacteriales bacterium]|nr:hypothetical protein [Mycobacteriales bacterium]
MRPATVCAALVVVLNLLGAPGNALAAAHQPPRTAVRPYPLQTLQVPRRADVVFTVPPRTPPAPGFPALPKALGDYFALYFPAIAQGWVNMRDPGSAYGWSSQFPLIGSKRFPDLVPHRRYRMLVAVQRPGRIQLPFPMHVLRVRRTAFRVGAVTHPIRLPAPASPVAIGAAPDTLHDFAVESTGIVLDWAADPSLTESVQGDACPAALVVGALACPKRNLSTYVITQTGFGRGTPLQVTIGEGFDRPVDAAYLSSYAANLPTPFDRATILAFAITPRPRSK